LIDSGLLQDNSPTLCVLILLVAIDVVVVFSLGWCDPPFISKRARVTRKVPESVTIVVLVGLYL
jgi:hypothetical protein